jgi:hypothetical protein
MMGKGIALLGWGSLLWESAGEFDAQHGPWQSDGPVLKIEFSRISSSRQGALTLVIDPASGVPATVAYCFSRRSDIAQAIEDLRIREGTSVERIGWVEPDGKTRFRDRQSGDAIRAWAAERDVDGVVWTDLPSNFAKKCRQPFSVPAALAYLQGLDAEGKAKALDYINRAPLFIRTPLRDAVADQMSRW